MNTSNSTQYPMAHKHQLNITNSQNHTKTQHSNLGTIRFTPPCYVCQSVSHFDHHQAQTKCKYKRKTATEEASTWKTVKCGVPQQPVLGQLLCHIYINDLPGSIDNSSNMTMHADDTSIFTANNCYEDLDSNSNTVLYNPSNGFRPVSWY